MSDKLKELKFSYSAVFKKYLLFFLPLSIIVSFVLGLLYYADLKVKQTSVKTNEVNKIKLKTNKIETDFDYIQADLLFLSTQQDLIENLGRITENASNYKQWKQELAQDYVSFSKYRKLYDQIRVINLRGEEIIRVNFNGGQPKIVPEEKLQNKVSRYWFEETLKQQPGQIFVSPLDLNIEQGKIEQPLKPMIRFAIPIYDSNGKKRGIMILNYLAKNFINDQFQARNTNQIGKILILNQQGFWLKGLKPEDEWGFMYPDRKDRTFQRDFPQEWQKIYNSRSGQFKTVNGLFTFITIYPLREIQVINLESSSRNNSVQNNPNTWKVISYLPSDILNRKYYSSRREFVLFYIGLLILLGIGCWLLSLSQVHRQLADANLQKTLADLTAILNNLTDGLLVTDKTGKITRYNPAYLKLLNLENDSLMNLESDRIFRSDLIQLIQQTQTNPKIVAMTEIELPSGRIGQAVATSIVQKISPNSTDEVMGSLLLIHDITNEKKINSMKNDFIATVSHELRSPLTSVLGFASIVQEKLDENLFPLLSNEDKKTKKTIKRVQSNLNIIVSEAERLTNLINDVLDIAKMEAGKVDWNMQYISIEEVINRAFAATDSLLQPSELEIIQEIEPELPEIYGDRERLIQVIINLISNAIKFTEEGQIICRAKVENNKIIVSVIDTGIGIALYDQGKIFDKFKQVGEILTDKPKGTGLGLPICQQIIEHHNGNIFVESILGEGSNFYFTLPISTVIQPKDDNQMLKIDTATTQRNNSTIAYPLLTSQDNFQILIVDDDPHIRDFLRQFLTAKNYKVQEAKNGMDAINKVKVQKPNLIILDVMMPQLNGFEVAAVLKNNPETRDIPIIILSIVEDLNRGKKLGVDRYFTKPIDTAGLLDAMDLLLYQGTSSKKVLVVDQKASTLMTLSQVLQVQGYNIIEVASNEESVENSILTQLDLVLVDSFLSQKHEFVKTLQFKKGGENIIFVLIGDEQDKSDNTTNSTS